MGVLRLTKCLMSKTRNLEGTEIVRTKIKVNSREKEGKVNTKERDDIDVVPRKSPNVLIR